MNVGVVGLGQIGSDVVRSLAGEPAFNLVGCDLLIEATERHVDQLTIATSPKELAEGCDIVLLALFDDDQVRLALDGSEGVLRATNSPKAIVILSTVKLATIRWAQERAAHDGIVILDCGVSRGAGREGRSTLVCMVGGDSETFAYILPVLNRIGDPVLHMGPLGAGMKTKIARNMMLFSFATVAFEGVRLAIGSGIDLEAFVVAAKACDLQSSGPYSRVNFPYDKAVPRSEKIHFAEYGHKDLRAAVALGNEVEIDLPVARLAESMFDSVCGLDNARGDE